MGLENLGGTAQDGQQAKQTRIQRSSFSLIRIKNTMKHRFVCQSEGGKGSVLEGLLCGLLLENEVV